MEGFKCRSTENGSGAIYFEQVQNGIGTGVNPMSKKLIETLQSLRDEIDNLDIGDNESKERLEKLVADIEMKINSPDDRDHHITLVEDLAGSVAHFEVSHPRVTGILNDIMMALSNMGV